MIQRIFSIYFNICLPIIICGYFYGNFAVVIFFFNLAKRFRRKIITYNNLQFLKSSTTEDNEKIVS